MNSMNLVGGFNPSEKYESQLGWLASIYGKLQFIFQTTNQEFLVESSAPGPGRSPSQHSFSPELRPVFCWNCRSSPCRPTASQKTMRMADEMVIILILILMMVLMMTTTTTITFDCYYIYNCDDCNVEAADDDAAGGENHGVPCSSCRCCRCSLRILGRLPGTLADENWLHRDILTSCLHGGVLKCRCPQIIHL